MALNDRRPPESENTGRKGYREPEELKDDRPMILHAPFWKDESERLTYEHAVESWPKHPGEGAMTYIARIAGIVERRKQEAVAKNFPPSSRLSPVEFHERQMELEAQREMIEGEL